MLNFSNTALSHSCLCTKKRADPVTEQMFSNAACQKIKYTFAKPLKKSITIFFIILETKFIVSSCGYFRWIMEYF